ncbi:MAG: ArsR family transcriptional regulator [bacterium]
MNMRSYKADILIDNKEVERLANISSLLKLISEESRLKILFFLRQKEHCVCEIMESTNLKLTDRLYQRRIIY